MGNPILYFFLLMLGIPFDLFSDAGHKKSKFPKTLLEKGLEFVISKRSSIIAFDLSFLLLPAKIDPVAEKRGCKKHVLRACGTGRVEIIPALLIEVIALHM